MTSKPSPLSESSKILFLSDVHLGAFSDEKNKQLEDELIRLIDYAETNDYRIALLGDLFDYWMEYPGFVPSIGQPVLERFEQFHKSSGMSLYITGNHDNWTLGHFSERGFDVEPNHRNAHINGRNVLLLHGDALGDHPEQLTRPLLHRLIRNQTFLKIYRGLLPPAAGLRVMKEFSKVSRFLGGDQNTGELDEWVQKLLTNTSVDMILCGHDHTPRIHKYDYGTYINLGTFYRHRSLAEYNNERFSLVTWNSKQASLCPFHTNP